MILPPPPTPNQLAAAQLGAAGGRVKSAAKAAAARANGLRGGRRAADEPPAMPDQHAGLSLQMLRDVARELPTTSDPWKLAEAGQLLAAAANELARLRKQAYGTK